ncbi:hypothetical protein AALC17_10405 [Oscillospiraceae bacterium 38-13]
MQYSLSQNDGYSTNIPQGTDAKTYTVYYKVTGDDYYSDVAAQSIEVTIAAQREETPSASIDYHSETLTGLTAGASYFITPTGGTTVTVAASGSGTIDIQESWYGKTLSIVKVVRDSDYSDSEAQSLPIPARPNRPAADAHQDGKQHYHHQQLLRL